MAVVPFTAPRKGVANKDSDAKLESTHDKFKWLKGVMSDHWQEPMARLIAFWIAQAK